MSGHRSWSEIKAGLSPETQAKIDERVKELLAEIKARRRRTTEAIETEVPMPPEQVSDPDHDISFPAIGRCPSCGSTNLHPYTWYALSREGRRTYKYAECGEPECGCHFGVASVLEIFVPCGEDEEQDDDTETPEQPAPPNGEGVEEQAEEVDTPPPPDDRADDPTG